MWEQVGIGEGDQEVQTIRYKINVTEIQYTTQGNSQYWSRVYKNIKSLCCTPETNIILYANYKSILKRLSMYVFTVSTSPGSGIPPGILKKCKGNRER